MVMSIRLDRAMETIVDRLARRTKKSRSEIVREALRAYLERASADEGRTKSVYERWKPAIGIVKLRRRDPSKSPGQLIREYLLEKKRQGRL